MKTSTTSSAKAAFFKSIPLDVKFNDQLEIVAAPYAEINITVEAVLLALVDKALFIDTHNGNTTPEVNRYKNYALFNRNNRVYICPVHATYQTCLNPLEVNEEGHIELSTGSIGGLVTADKLADLVKEGYLVGYVKVLN